MKKTMRKLLAITVMMATLLSTTLMVAQAEDLSTTTGSGDYTVIISNANNTGVSIAGDWFHAYQIFIADDVTSYSVTADFRDFFIGTLTGGDGSNSSYNFDQYLTIIDAYEALYSAEAPSEDPTEVATYNTALDNYNQLAGSYMNSYANNMYALAIQMREYLDSVGAHSGGDVTCSVHAQAAEADSNGYEYATLVGLDTGYYFVFDQESEMNGIGISASGAFIPLTSGSSLTTTVDVKQSIPTMTKSIFHDDTNTWDIVGDSQIGDKVAFRVISTLPTNIKDYIEDPANPGFNEDGDATSGEYSYILTDTMSAGLTYNTDVAIYTDEGITPVDSQYYTVEDTADGFKITFDAIAFLTAYPSQMTLYTYYSATLNENAVVASDYDENTAVLEYSFNPADENDIGSTDSTVFHYTFALDVNKVDESGAGLAGARFGLFDTDGYAIPLVKGETDTTTGVVSYYYDLTATGTVSDGGFITTETVELDDGSFVSGKFAIYGLNDKVYYTLREVEAPDGYNPSDAFDIYFSVTYNALGTEITYLTDGSAYIFTSQDAVTEDWSSSSTIVNRLKIYLPETGGMGTVLFQVGGGALMLGAAVMLLVNQRKKEKS